MYPNWHGRSYYDLFKYYGLRGLWHQFWYDVRYWSVLK